MAETSSAEYSNSGGGQIVADVLARRQRAKVIRDLWMPLYQECFDYAMPYRQSFYEESPGQKRTHKIFDDTAVVGVQEFASRLQDGIAPANARFCDLLAGTEFDPDRIAYLASLGIGQREAQLLARMPVERTPSGQLILPAIHNWGDERARKIFFNAMLAEENRTIITPGPADLPNLARGVVGVGNRRYESQLFGLPFQFLSFSLAAHNKLLVSALQGRERNTMGGFVALRGSASSSTTPNRRLMPGARSRSRRRCCAPMSSRAPAARLFSGAKWRTSPVIGVQPELQKPVAFMGVTDGT